MGIGLTFFFSEKRNMMQKEIKYGIICLMAISALIVLTGVVPVARLRRSTTRSNFVSAPGSAFEFRLKITNRIYNESLLDANSLYYKLLRMEVENMLTAVFNDPYLSYECVAEIAFSNGSVIANTILQFRNPSDNKILIRSLFTDNYVSSYSPKILDLDMTYIQGEIPTRVPYPLKTTMLAVSSPAPSSSPLPSSSQPGSTTVNPQSINTRSLTINKRLVRSVKTTIHPTNDTTVPSTNDTTSHPTNNTTSNPTNETTSHPTNGKPTTSHPTNGITIPSTNDTTSHPTNDTTSHPTNVITIPPTNDTTRHPTNDTSSHPTNNTTSHPTNDTTSHPTNGTTTHPTNGITIPSTNDTTSHPTNDTISHPTNVITIPPTNDTTSPPTNDTTSHPTNVITIPSTNDTTSPPTNDTTSHPTNNTTSHPTNDTISHPTNGMTIHPTNDTTSVPINSTTSHSNNFTTSLPFPIRTSSTQQNGTNSITSNTTTSGTTTVQSGGIPHHPTTGTLIPPTVHTRATTLSHTSSKSDISVAPAKASAGSHVLTESAGGAQQSVPGWAIALLVLAALILLLLLLLLIWLLVWVCCRRDRAFSPYNPIDIPLYSTHSRFELPNGKPFDEIPPPSKNRTGMYVVNK